MSGRELWRVRTGAEGEAPPIFGALWAFVLLVAGPLGAAPEDDLSCAYFSPDPNDRAGPPIRFFADLSDHGQRAPTNSSGVGRADFVLERDTLRLTWQVTFADLTSRPIALQLHGPVPAEGEAPPIFALAPEQFTSPVEGERTLSLGEVAYLVQNLLYVNLLTTRYPMGELRGLVRKVRPACKTAGTENSCGSKSRLCGRFLRRCPSCSLMSQPVSPTYFHNQPDSLVTRSAAA